jgi:isoleucyl-tRNA synthetase
MVILATYVSDGDGTGLVHNAPDFGNDDYLACMKYNIKPFGPIDNYGKFNKNINDDELVGVFYNDANKIITEKLTKANALLNLSFITHSVAHD